MIDQKELRTLLSIYAYSYEMLCVSLVPDSEYDRMSLLVDTEISTDSPKLDEFFKKEFASSTGTWVYSHPDLEEIGRRAEEIINDRDW